MFRNHKRLYFFTGKGGVGKTSFALALTKFLESEGVNVAYFNFDQSHPQKIISLLQVPTISQTTEESAKIYIEGKLGSRTVANWILKTTFFKSLLNITPSIGYMISLGHIINRLENDPSLTIVIDAPASGHTLSLFNSTHNFKEMFKVGPLVEDIYKMHNFLKKSENIKVCILCLPNIMNVQEALELKSGLNNLKLFEGHLILNEILTGLTKDELGALPSFLREKISIEQNLKKQYEQDFNEVVPFLSSTDYSDIVRSLINFMRAIA